MRYRRYITNRYKRYIYPAIINYLRKRIKFMEKAIAELKDKEPDLKWTEYEE